ncbi:ABC transporter ATP-binding protein [Aliamphritea hakodatensis]|uniref:ABC transporter ATP-binding protein n=1 Tax=Aliamphritea hakodatensis TaxID=2895352 RepID=UPI0022FD72FE|nr:ABC transporter ATP-binding protein [Aliamphritea hakodatensis]
MLAGAGVLTVLRVVAALAVVLFVYRLIDGMVDQDLNRSDAVLLAVQASGAALLSYVFFFVSALLSHKAAFHLSAEIKVQLAERLLRLSPGLIGKRHSASIHQVLHEDINRIELFIAHHVTDLLAALLMPVLAAGVLFYFDWRLALVALLPLPLAFVLQGILFRGFEARASDYYEVLEALNRSSAEVIRGTAALRMLPGARENMPQLTDSISRYKSVVEGWMKGASWPFSVLKVSLDVGLVVLLPLAAWLTLQGDMGIATFLLFMMLGLLLTEPLYSLLMFMGFLNQILQGVRRIEDLESCVQSVTGQTDWPGSVPPVVTEDLSFAFPEREAPVLQQISLAIKPGEKVAVIGASGSGKSTFIKLLAGFYPVSQGRILFAGTDAGEYHADQRNSRVGVVLQENHIFNRTLRENVTLGDQIPDEQVWRALQLSQALSFVKAMPDGLDTVLGGHVARLSGGEKQRIALARVLVREADIYLFDEATSFFDARIERQLLSGLFTELAAKTMVFVTHRLAMAQQADRILVIDAGRVVGDGSPAELAVACPYYQALCAQAEMSVAEEVVCA